MRIRIAALLPLLALTACPAYDPMQRQQKLKAYQPSPQDGRAPGMRHPPAGTVEWLGAHDPVVATGLLADGKPVERIPVEVNAGLLARGRSRFEVSCAVCHGLVGDGESQVALNMSLRRPPSLHAYRDVTDGYLYQVITNGFGLMPAYRAELPVEDRWAIVAYVRALQLSQAAALDQVPPEDRKGLLEEQR